MHRPRIPHPPEAETIVYAGQRIDGQGAVTRTEGHMVRDLDPCHNVENHSPTGFSWGYGGSGPTQLALALAMDATRDQDRALAVYKDLKRSLVAGLPQDQPWRMTQGDVLAAIDELENADPDLVARAERNRQRREDEKEILRLEAEERAAGR